MNKLDEFVGKLMETIDEEFILINSLNSTHSELVKKQEEKIRYTAIKLLPLMEKIQSKGYRFSGNKTEYQSSRGPVLKHDSRENILYVFSVEDKKPIAVNLYNNDVKNLTYRMLLEQVDFTSIMEGLLLVLTHHNYIKKNYQVLIDELEAELAKFEDIL